MFVCHPLENPAEKSTAAVSQVATPGGQGEKQAVVEASSQRAPQSGVEKTEAAKNVESEKQTKTDSVVSGNAKTAEKEDHPQLDPSQKQKIQTIRCEDSFDENSEIDLQEIVDAQEQPASLDEKSNQGKKKVD